ncbi:ROK family transcriptional regulator [Agromyces kandeliae]|uniref:ROK family protein n=1 Tax=Agromyces kandeliae TaxID=2666141 RepID=A0A6L5R240_9MICO|nr:ROK family transcriptional regulator [Agromyces kandeliae]MRX44059.1 ROK family protein [Agromyces kandeliae]
MTQPGATAARIPSESTAVGQGGRADHAAQVIDHLFVNDSATRAELAGATGLGRTAVAGLVTRMVEAGVLVDPESGGDGRHGRLRLAIADGLLLTAGVAADDAIATLAQLDGTEIARYEEPVAIVEDDPRPAEAAPLDALGVVVDRAIAQAERDGRRIAEVTLIVQGAVVGEPALALGDATLGLDPLDVASALRARSERLAGIERDLVAPPALRTAASARAAGDVAAAERRDDIVLHVSGDAQVSAAIVVRGAPYPGAHGLAATFGHLPIVPNGIKCECGQRGCLATVAAPGVVLAKAELQDFELTYGRRAAIAELAVRIADSEDRARWAWLDAALWIGRALQVVVPTIDPDVVVVGGWWAPLVADIDASFRDNRPKLGGGALDAIPRLTAGTSGDDLGLVGARAQARDGLRASLASDVA